MAHRLALVAVILAGFSGYAGAQPAAPKLRKAGSLRLHKPINRKMGPGQADLFTVHVKAGAFIHVVVEQRGVDIVLTIQDPAGRELISMDSPNGQFGFEPASAIATAAGLYRVKVTNLSVRSGGNYRVELMTLRPPTDEDRLRVRAEAVFLRAVPDQQAREKERRGRAIEEYSEANKIWRELNDAYEEALGLESIGAIHSGLGDKEKALEFYNQALPIQRAVGDRAGEATTLNNIGVIYSDGGTQQKALEYYNQALPIRRALGDLNGEADTLSNLGVAYSALGEKQKAIGYYEQALPVQRAAGDRTGEATTLKIIGAIYSDSGAKQKAREYYDQALPIFRRAGQRSGEADTLIKIGMLHSDLGEKQRALEFYNQALPIVRAIGDRAGEANALNNIGVVYSDIGSKQKALEYYNQVLPIRRAVGDRNGEATALTNLGMAYSGLGEKQKALLYYNQALAIQRTVGDRAREATTLDYMGLLYSDLGEGRTALEFLNQALPILRAVGDRAGEATTLHNIGGVYSDLMGEKQKALDYYNQALTIDRAIGSRQGEAHALNNIGLVYSFLGQKEKALEYYNQALPILRAVGDRPNEAGTLNNIGVVYSELGEKQTALEYYQQALPVNRDTDDRVREANTLNSIGAAYSDLGEKQKALEAYNQALPIRRAVGDRTGEANTLGNMGLSYSQAGEHQKALQYYNQALLIHRAVGDRPGEAHTLRRIGVLYAELGERQKALEYYNQVLPIQRAVGDRNGEGDTLNDIGYAYFGLGERQEALKYYNQALPIQRTLGDRNGEVRTLSNIGVVYSESGEKQKALEYYGQALPVQRAIGDRRGEAVTLNNIGVVYYDLGQHQKALEYYNQALPIQRAIGYRAGEAHTLHNLERLFRESQPDLAVLFGKQAVNILQSIRRDNRGLEEQLQRSYEKSIESNYRSLADLLIQRGRFGEAEEVLNLLKDKEASDFIRRDSVSDNLRSATLRDFEKSALDRYDQIVDQIAGFGRRKAALTAKASLTPDELQESTRLDADLKAANLVLNRYFEEQEQAFSAKSSVAKRVVEVKDAEGLQESLETLGSGVVAIYTLLMPDRYEAILVTSHARKAYASLVKEEDLNKKIGSFRQQLQNPASDPLPLAKELYAIVFPEGLRKDLDEVHAKTIMWSVDSTLRYIPFAALHDGKQYLVQSFQQSMFTPDLLKHITDAPPRQWTGAGFGVSEGNNPLPSVPNELRGIFKETPDSRAPVPGVVRLDAAFSHANFESDLRQKRPVVHIATHFDSQPGVAANSALLLGDGPLSLAEIASGTRMFEGVDLLTLSACNTAFKNGYQDGREVDSFGTIAQRQGAKGVIASLWSVNDPATANLMETMYRLRQQTVGMPKGEALRQAQVAMLSGELRPGMSHGEDVRGVAVHQPSDPAKAAGDWSHPYYWAPFILLGNWK